MFDSFGRVFFKDNRVFRAISYESADDCKMLLKEPFFVELMDKGLIPKTIISDVKLDDYAFVLEHEKLLNIVQHEWSFSMMKSAALTILEIIDICEYYNYELKDAHTLNVLFRGGQAVYVDIGSFSKKKEKNWSAYQEFLYSFFIPLSFWSEGKYYIVRILLNNIFYRMQTIPSQSLVDSGLLKLLKKENYIYEYNFYVFNSLIFKTKSHIGFLNSLSKAINWISTLVKRKNMCVLRYSPEIKDIKKIKSIISRMEYPNTESLWKNYHSKFYNKEGKLYTSNRFNRIIEIINSINSNTPINSLLDLAGNEGLLSFLIEQRLKIRNITLSDYDENAIEKAYEKREELNSQINIILLNFMFPQNIEDTAQRLRSDIVLALAVTHHLILTSQYHISTIFERIKLYSNRYVLVEFMPKGLWSIENPVNVNVPEWYNADWFKKEFEKEFNILHQENLEDNRLLFVGEIRN